MHCPPSPVHLTMHAPLTLDTSLIHWLLQEKFARVDDAAPDSRSAWNWLQQKQLVPSMNVTFDFSGELRVWSVNVHSYLEKNKSVVSGHGIATDKKAAEKKAYLDAFRELCMYLPNHLADLLGTADRSLGVQLSVNGSSASSPLPNDVVPSSGASNSSSSLSYPLSSRSTSASSSGSYHILTSSLSPTVVHNKTNTPPLPQLTPKQQLKVAEAAVELTKFKDRGKPVEMRLPFVVVALDVEKYDKRGRSEILEVGVDMILPPGKHHASPRRLHRHFIVQEHEHLENVYCKNDRSAYAHGISIRISEIKLMEWLRLLTTSLLCGSNATLIGHTLRSDMQWLAHRCSELQQSGDIDFCIDFGRTSTVDLALVDRAVRSHYESRKLRTVGEEYGVRFVGSPHNAGNDAVFTMDTWVAMSHELAGLSVSTS